MSYEQATHFAQTWGLIALAVGFAAAVLYALWPANRAKFDRAARAPLDDEDDNGR
ncbi:MAG: cytochrome-c oxidase [Proteobacteria bacterium HN_bin10]|jgi:cytochrome c oxidase cbb3-type subunit 4|nr:MAG: cytochrome-c oxidase [Proteobacteria bacterium HN_bin10]